ncbi:cytochrome P450 [Candidatus Palauibacter sp.]|uniref:cytochrome P450 n=1 Tax=Candidatus Palauibacter sp. TaxID=3101350 RepID=UPI003B02D7BF
MVGNLTSLDRFPLGASVRLADLAVDPYPIFAELREAEPVTWVPEIERWFLTRRDDILAVLRDPDLFTTDAPSTIRDMFGAHMMTTEGPTQIRYKRKCLPPFHASRLASASLLRLTAEVERLVTGLRSGGRRAGEVRTGLARPVALHSVLSVLGIPLSETDRVNEWYEHFARALANFAGDPDLRAAGKGAADAYGRALAPILEELERKPDGNLLSDLVCDHVDPLTAAEIRSNSLIILFGGIETTESMIANAVWALLSHPEQHETARASPAALDLSIEETLRWEPAVQSAARHATRDTEIRGVRIAEGEVVHCMLGAANRDPAYFEDPDLFDVTRPNAGDHLSFAVGRHFCLGAPLARLETRVVLKTLWARCPGLRLDPDRPSAPYGYEFRKPPTLQVKWDR